MGGPIRASVLIGLIAAAAAFDPSAARAQDASRPAAANSGDSSETGVQHITAGPIAVDLSLDHTSINAAQSVVATLRVTAPASVHVELPAPDGKLDGFTVAGVMDDPERAANLNGEVATVRTRRYTLEPFLPGDYTVPPLEVNWRRDNGETGAAHTQPVTVKVVSLLPEAAQGPSPDPKALDPGTIRAEYTPAAPKNWWPVAVIAGTGLGALLLAGWGARAYRRRRREPDVVPALITRVESLRATVNDRPAAPDLYHELAESIHIALADRVDPRARSLPAAETASGLPRTAFFSGDDARGAQALLVKLDEARFSGATLPRDERDQLMIGTLDLLRKLRAMPPRRNSEEATA